MSVGCGWRYRPESWPMAYSKDDRAFDMESENRTEGCIYQQYKQWRKWILYRAIGYVPFNFKITLKQINSFMKNFRDILLYELLVLIRKINKNRPRWMALGQSSNKSTFRVGYTLKIIKFVNLILNCTVPPVLGLQPMTLHMQSKYYIILSNVLKTFNFYIL